MDSVIMHMENHDLPVGHIDYCQICNSKNLELILDLGHQPPCDSLLEKSQLKEPENTFPLNFVVCKDCGLSQIDFVVDPKILFYNKYPYRSGITKTLTNYLRSISESIVGTYPLKKESLVVDIGSNDGTLLSGFKDAGFKVLGVEPTDIADIANSNGIQTIKSFFDKDAIQEILGKHGKASVVTGTNVFAHVNNLSELITCVSDLLVNDGIFLTESHYLLNILDTVQYDSIYHEHLKYYSLKSIIKLFSYFDFTVIDAEKIPNYGGSIRVIAQKGRSHKASDRISKLIQEEEEAGLYGLDRYFSFRDLVKKSKADLLSLLYKLKKEGKTVPGIGCPGRSITLLNYCKIDRDLMPYIAEQQDCLKVGMFAPHAHIPIVDEKILFEENPEYCVMLSWHYAGPIIKNLRNKGLKSKIIVPLPDVNIIG